MAWNHCFFDVPSLKLTFAEKWQCESAFVALPLDGVLWFGLYNIFHNMPQSTRKLFEDNLLWIHSKMKESLQEYKDFYDVCDNRSIIDRQSIDLY